MYEEATSMKHIENNIREFRLKLRPICSGLEIPIFLCLIALIAVNTAGAHSRTASEKEENIPRHTKLNPMMTE
jgi:hypothetical protein